MHITTAVINFFSGTFTQTVGRSQVGRSQTVGRSQVGRSETVGRSQVEFEYFEEHEI